MPPHDRFMLDINLGPFRLLNFPLEVDLVRCDDAIFEGKADADLTNPDLDVCLHSLRCDDGRPSIVHDDRELDPAYRQFSPGFVHHVKLIEEAFDNPDCRYFDFGLSAFQYKEQLSTDQAECANVLVLSKTPRNRLAIALHRSMVALTSCINRQIEFLGVKRQLRQWLRGTA